jgi:hypothetical protein
VLGVYYLNFEYYDKIPEINILKEEFILAHGLRGLLPWLTWPCHFGL